MKNKFIILKTNYKPTIKNKNMTNPDKKTNKTSILLTNDDGIYAPGLQALYRVLKDEYDLYIFAPSEEKSGTGHAITFTEPLRAKKITTPAGLIGTSVNGTPADCVKIGLIEKMTKKPNFIISGINHGPNFGTLLHYSGTAAAAREGAIQGIPSLAVSLATKDTNAEFDRAAEITKAILIKIEKETFPENTFLNINIPYTEKALSKKNIVTTSLAPYCFSENFIKRKDSRNVSYYWMDMSTVKVLEPSDDILYDVNAIKNDKISITPVTYQQTCFANLDTINGWNLDCV